MERISLRRSEEGLRVAQYYCVLDEVSFSSFLQFSGVSPITGTRCSDIYAGGKVVLNEHPAVFAINGSKIGGGDFNFDIWNRLTILIHHDQTQRRTRLITDTLKDRQTILPSAHIDCKIS